MVEAAVVAEESPHPALGLAADRADLFDEHTWGFFDPSPDHPEAQTAELLKQSLAHEAHQYASLATMDALESLAENPVADRGVSGVLICNPSPYRRVIRASMPEAWFGEPASTERTYRARRMYYDNRPWRVPMPGEQSRVSPVIELPPMSWQIVPIDDVAAAGDFSPLSHEVRELSSAAGEAMWDAVGMPRSDARIGRITSPFHTLEYDPDTGRVLSLVDTVLGREILNTSHRYDFFAFVREGPDALIDGTREAFYRRNLRTEKFDGTGWREWDAVREAAVRVTACTVHVTPGRITLERRVEAPGMRRLVQRISFSDYQPIIELEAEMEFIPDTDPFGAYFAFPLAVGEGWDAGFDTAGQFVRLDEDQLPGANRSWVTTESFATISSQDLTVALLTPDAPMVQFGDFHFGPPLDAVPRGIDPLLLAWPVNNYWMTNYPLVQSGHIRLRYGFTSSATMDVDAMRRHAYELRHSPLVWPVTTGGREPGNGTFRPKA
jgi:hypothetical protein